MSRFFGRVSVNRIAGRSSLNPKTDWLVPLIGTAKAVESAGDLMPFPYIGEAAGIVVKLLEGIQRVKKNKDDFRELAESIVDIIRAVRDEIVNTMKKTHGESSPDSSRLPDFREPCTRFIDYLVGLLKEVDEASRKNDNWIKQYLKSNEMRDAIARNQKRVEHHRANFTLSTVVNMRMYVQETMVLSKSEPSSGFCGELERLSQDYHSLILGDLNLEDERERPPGPQDVDSKTTLDYVATVRGTTSTVRIYQGEHASEHFLSDLRMLSSLRHPNVMQVFGICKSSACLALVFHGDYITIDQHLTTLDPFESIQFQYRMKRDYLIGWSHLKQWLPHCHNNVESLLLPDLSPELFSYGCRCHWAVASKVLMDHCLMDHCLRTLVNPGSGKICLSISHPGQSLIYSPRTEQWYDSSYDYLQSLVSRSVLLPLGSTQWSLTSLKSKMLGFFQMVASISKPIIQRATWHGVRTQITIGGLDNINHCPSRQYLTLRVLVIPPPPYQATFSKWKSKTDGVPVCYPSEEWSRFSLTRLTKRVLAETDTIGVDPLAFMMPLLIHAPSVRLALINQPVLDLCVATHLHGKIGVHIALTSDAPEVVYLFVENLRIDERGVVRVPIFFCSRDPAGQDRFSEGESFKMGIDTGVTPSLQGRARDYPAAAWHGIEDLCKRSGIQLDTDSIFRLLDLPPCKLELRVGPLPSVAMLEGL